MSARRSVGTKPAIEIDLTEDEARSLAEISHHYEQLWGRARHIVVWTTSRKVRRRYRFIVQESNDLELQAQSLVVGHDDKGVYLSRIPIVDAVAFWGRLLSNVRTKRSRRKLPAEVVQARELLAEKFRTSIKAAEGRFHNEIDAAVATRRPMEAGWMRELLATEDLATTSPTT